MKARGLARFRAMLAGAGLAAVCATLSAGLGPAAAQAPCDNPSAACGDALQTQCLRVFGAGAIAAPGGEDARCAEEFSAYRACLTRLVGGCGPAEPWRAPQRSDRAAVAVDLALADYSDPAAVAAVFGAGAAAGFPYVMETAALQPGVERRLRPAAPYFRSLYERGYAYQVAKHFGYFSPEEGTTGWRLSAPAYDLIARRAADDLTLGDLVVEVAESTPDPCPYTEVVSVGDEMASFYLVNQSWAPVRSATVEFDFLFDDLPDGPEETPADARLRLRIEQGAPNFAYRIEVGDGGGFDQFLKIDVSEALAQEWAGFAEARRDWDAALDGDIDARKRAADRPLQRVALFGRLTTRAPSGGGCDEMASYFRVNLPIAPPDGLGGGFIDFNLNRPIDLRTQGRAYQSRLRIGYLLDEADPVFRGAFPLRAPRSSRHRMRLALRSGRATVWTSDWIEAHLIVPRLAAEVAAAAR